MSYPGRIFDFTSADGTRIRGWHNDSDGIPVLISNGLGTPPTAWPEIAAPSNGYRVATWFYRGTGGSARPADEQRITVMDHVADMQALMDVMGFERALVVGWSLGVNIGFEFAQLAPDRVAGILAVAGVPGGTYDALMGPIPRRLRKPIGVRATRIGVHGAGLVNAITHHLPINRTTAQIVNHSGLMFPSANPDLVVRVMSEFMQHDFQWYFRLALAGAEHPTMQLEFVECPVVFAAGRWDVLTALGDIQRAAQQIPHAEVHVLSGTHFLPLEHPAELAHLLDELADESDLRSFDDADANPTPG